MRIGTILRPVQKVTKILCVDHTFTLVSIMFLNQHISPATFIPEV